MYPLREDYEEQVLNFIDLLKQDKNLEIRVNAMSTQVTGPFDTAFKQVQDSIRKVYKKGVKASFVVKVLHGELDLDFRL